MMCAIERHPDSSTRDSLTHTLFNLIKRPDEQQRRIIMDVGYCFNLEAFIVHNKSGMILSLRPFTIYLRHVLAYQGMLEK